MRRARFLLDALSVYRVIKPMLNAPAESPLGRLLRSRPETVGAVSWPYLCAGWDAPTRLARICEHYAVVEECGWPIDFSVEDERVLVDLGEIHDGLRAVLDQPRSFLREGQLAISLFIGSVRIYTLAFLLARQSGARVAFVGAIQGSNLSGSRDQYCDLTKVAHGLRPRDLLIEIFRMHCAMLDVSQIFAVAEDYRVQRSEYLRRRLVEFVSYDVIWKDRNGVRLNAMFFRLEVQSRQRSADEIPARKRGMYRRRYAFLQSLQTQMRERMFGLLAPAIAKAHAAGRALQCANQGE